MHQRSDWRKGGARAGRVTRGSVVLLTFDGDVLHRFWIAEYVPELIEAERGRFQPLDALCEALGGATEVRKIPIPLDCVDGFTEAYYGRPERFLDPAVRRSQSA